MTLDDDVAATLERLRKTRKASLKELVNEALRRGLQAMGARPKRRATFRTRSIALGGLQIGRIDNVAESLALVEGESFK